MDDPSDIEGAFAAPITGREVSAWLIDVIHQLVDDGGSEFSPQSRAALDRILELGDPRITLDVAVRVAAALLIEFRFQAALPPGTPGDAEEKLRRTLLSGHSIFRGDGPRNPFMDSTEG